MSGIASLLLNGQALPFIKMAINKPQVTFYFEFNISPKGEMRSAFIAKLTDTEF